MDSSVNNMEVSKKGLGTFEVPISGDYEFTVTAPVGERRIISLSEGTLIGAIGKIFGQALGAIILGLLGMMALIFAFIFFFTKRKKQPPSLPHAT